MDVAKKLSLTYNPVGIWFKDEKPEGAFEFDPATRPCVVSMLVAASKGKTVAVSDEACTCPGGAVGLGFGDAFERRDAPTMWMLAHGHECPDWPKERTLRPGMERGERFFCSSEASNRWRAEMNLTEATYRYVVFAPLEARPFEDDPDLVWLLANPDQLSALIIMCGYSTGRSLNVIAPFCAGCQSIALAKQYLEKEDPLAIMGMFDISQRHRLPKEVLSLTMPFAMYADIEAHCEEGCLTTPSWENIANRFGGE